MKKVMLIACTSLLFACNSSNKRFWPVSKFNLKPDALKNNSEIKLVYTSQRPPDMQDCYIHIIAISQKYGDTINILTASDNAFEKADSSKIFTFLDENNMVTKLFQNPGDELVQNGNYDSLIKNTTVRRLTKVIRNPEFDYIADNKFPTVIGSIGFTTVP